VHESLEEDDEDIVITVFPHVPSLEAFHDSPTARVRLVYQQGHQVATIPTANIGKRCLERLRQRVAVTEPSKSEVIVHAYQYQLRSRDHRAGAQKAEIAPM
jgi:hypothetical protein